MKLEKHIIELVNEHIGFEGKPYKILYGGWNETPCYSWDFPSDVLDSPSFTQLDNFSKDLILLEELENFNIDPILFELYSLLKGKVAYPYKSIEFCTSIYRTLSRTLVVSPFVDKYDVFRLEEGLLFSPGNSSPAHEEVINYFRSLDDSYGLDIIGAGGASVEFKLGRCPTPEESKSLSEEIKEIAPDIIGDYMEFRDLIDFDRSNCQITLWWDDLVYSMGYLNAG